MDTALEIKLIECLDALEQGESLELILRRYPDDAAALRPMLETARQLVDLPVGYPVAAQTASRNAFLQEAARLRDRQRRPSFFDWLLRPRLSQPVTPSLLAAALVVLLISALVFALLNDTISPDALGPGETSTVPANTPLPTQAPALETTTFHTLTTTATVEPTSLTPTDTATPEPTGTITVTVAPSPTPSLTPTVTPSRTRTPQPPPTTTVTETPEPPTAVPTVAPTDTFVPPPPTATPDDDNENDNDNENENENENENDNDDNENDNEDDNNSGPGNGNHNDNDDDD